MLAFINLLYREYCRARLAEMRRYLMVGQRLDRPEFPGTLSRPRTLIALVNPEAAFRCKTPSFSPAAWCWPWP